MTIFQRCLAGLILGVMSGGAALAQSASPVVETPPVAAPPAAAPPTAAPPAAAVQPVVNAPVVTTYESWFIRCQRAPDQPGTARKLCEMAQIVLDQNQQIVAQVVLAQPNGAGDWLLVAQIPVDITVATVVQLNVDGIDPVRLPLKRCVGNSCVAELVLDEATMGRLRQAPAGSPGSMTFTRGTGGEMRMPFSLQGFTVAFNVLSTQ